MSTKRSGEFSWIAEHFAPLAGEGSFGLRDDAALLQTDGPIVLTQDTIVEGIHFLPDDPPGTVAGKALRVNVSDVVAKGARPDAVLLSLGVPERWGNGHVADFAAGLGADLERYRLRLVGGDTTASPDRLFVTVTMTGRPIRAHVSRLGARPGDAICLLGPVGDGSAGLHEAREGRAGDLADRYRLPPVDLGAAELVATHASAAMDVSDGLIGDLEKLCAASGVRGEVALERLPVSPEVRAWMQRSGRTLIDLATGGDDYVVLMTTAQPPPNAAVIGRITQGKDVGVSLDGVPVTIGRASYIHD